MFCAKCGNKLEDGDKFCIKCGTRVIPVAQPATPQPENTAQPQYRGPQPESVAQPPQYAAPRQGGTPPKKPLWPKIVIPAACLLVLGLGIFFGLRHRKNSDNAQTVASQGTEVNNEQANASGSGENPSEAGTVAEESGLSGDTLEPAKEPAAEQDAAEENNAEAGQETPAADAGKEAEAGDTPADGQNQDAGNNADPAAQAASLEAERNAAFAEVLLQYEDEHGTAQCLTWEDMQSGVEGYPHSKGVYYADLMDLDGDGTEELVIGYSSKNGEEYHADQVDVFTYTDRAVKHSAEKSTLAYGVDGASICWYTFGDGTYLVAGSMMDENDPHVHLYRFDGIGFVSVAEADMDHMASVGDVYFYDFGKGQPAAVDEYFVYGLSNADRDKMITKLRETKARLGITEEQGDGVMDEVAMRQHFSSAVTDSWMFFIYDDFDYDGASEAFVGVGNSDGLYGRLFFVSSDGSIRDVSGNHELSTFLYIDGYDADVRDRYLVDTGTQKFFVWENSAGGSGSTSYVYGLRNGQVYEPQISGHAEAFQQQGSEFVSYESDFSKEFHDYIETFYRFDAGAGEFYRE